MRYIGSKTLLLNEIYTIIHEHNKSGVICDPFGGIGTVGSYMKRNGYQIITGDILSFANCFQVAQIVCSEELAFSKIKEEINVENYNELSEYFNRLSPKYGWLVKEYSENRKFFTSKNAMKIQACLDCIWKWNTQGLLEENEYKVLVASLIQSSDKVANTAGTYYAYLKDYYRKARNLFSFDMLLPVKGSENCKAYLEDANSLVKRCKYDVLYLDPPYNERNYGRYYHLPETFAKGEIPHPKGKSGVYVKRECISAYNKKNEATDAFERLISDASAQYIIFHYTDNGIIKESDVRDILKEKGKVEELYMDSKGYVTMSDMKQSQHHIYKVIV